MKKVAIFARVSTSIQDYERQVNELTALAVRNEWTVEALKHKSVFAESTQPVTESPSRSNTEAHTRVQRQKDNYTAR